MSFDLIEKDFKEKHRNELSDSLLTMLVLDSSQLTDDAFLYFLPKILTNVSSGKCVHYDTVRRRILRLDTKNSVLNEKLKLARVFLLEVARTVREVEKEEFEKRRF